MTTFYGYYAPVAGSIAYVTGAIPSMADNQAISFASGAGMTLPYFPVAEVDPDWFIGSLGFAVGADFTWEFWIKTTQNPGAAVRLVEQASGGVYPYRIQLLPGGTVRAGRSDGSLTATVDSLEAVNDGTWHYVTVHKSATTFAVTVDGNFPATTTDTLVSSTALTVDAAVAGDGFIGALDELAVYPSALTTTQRSRHRSAAAGTEVAA